MPEFTGVNGKRILAPRMRCDIVQNRIVRDWSVSYRNMVMGMQVVPGPVCIQKRSQISEAIFRSDFGTLCRILDVSKVILREGGSCGSCSVALKSATRLSKSNRKLCALCDTQFCTKCVVNFPLRFPSGQVCKSDVCVPCSQFLLKSQLILDPWFNCGARRLFDLHARATDELVQLSARLSNYEGLVRFFAMHKEHIMLKPLQELEGAIRAGFGSLNQVLKEVPKTEAFSEYLVSQLRDKKVLFNQSLTLFERITL